MTTIVMSFLLSTEPDPRGNWKLSGLAVDYLHIARETTGFYLTVDYPSLAGTAFSSSSDCQIRVDETGAPTGDDSGTLIANPAPSSVCIHLQDIPAGVMFNRLTNGPFTDTGLGGIGVNLNVNIYDGGNGTIAQGSFYPDIELSESQDCVTDLQIFAVNENFSWEVGTQSTFNNKNVLGMDNGLLCDDQNPEGSLEVDCAVNDDEAWGFGLVTGLFDETPSTPVPVRVPPHLPYVALTDGTVLGYSCQTALTAQACGDLGWDLAGGTFTDIAAVTSDTTDCMMNGGDQATCTADATVANTTTCTDCTTDCITAMGAGAATLGGSIAACESADYAAATLGPDGVPGGGDDFGGVGWLHGTGTSSKFNVSTGASAMCDTPGCNPDVDFKLVWDALDSAETGLGFGDLDFSEPGGDEDGDGTPYDRIFGVPYIDVTHLNTTNPLCDISGGTAEGNAFTLPVAGDILSQLGATQGCDDPDDYPSAQAQQACSEVVVANFIENGCYDSTRAKLEKTCDDTPGGVATLVFGGCVEQATGEVSDTCDAAVLQAQAGVAASCATSAGADSGDAYDACYAAAIDAAEASAISAVIEGACVGAGGPATIEESMAMGLNGLTCGALGDQYASVGGGTCAGAVTLAIDTASSSLCSLAGTIGATDYPSCEAFADSYDEDGLDGLFEDATTVTDPNGNVLAAGITCGTYGQIYVPTCLETAGEYNLDTDTEMYLFKPGAGLDQWGNFFTYNGSVFSSFAAQALTGQISCLDADLDALDGADGNAGLVDMDQSGGTPDATDVAMFVFACHPYLLENDSKWDFDPSCLYDGNPLAGDVDENGDYVAYAEPCGGRLTMTFEPTCVRELEARQIVAEFVDLTDLCSHSGDVDYSCNAYDWNYNYVADINGDGITAAECEDYADSIGFTFYNSPGPILPSCDPEEGITTGCDSYVSTVVWHAAYASTFPMCGDGDPNDLIDLGKNTFCGLAMGGSECGVPTPAFDSMQDCFDEYDAQGGIPSFETSCTVGDCSVSVTDVVRIINHIIGNDATFGNSVDQLGGEAACEADFNDDGNINVVDVVAIVNSILANNGGRLADASEASILTENNKIVIDADGYIGAVDIVVEFSDNASFEIADGFASTSRIVGNKAHIILIGDKEGVSEVLTVTSGKIVNILEVLVANSSDFVTTSINQPSIFSVGAAYPNPFNPSTNISLVLNANADLSVKVYNLTGQLVDVIAEGNFNPSSYNWTWKAENLASGVYFIKAQVGSEVSTQKVMLLK